MFVYLDVSYTKEKNMLDDCGCKESPKRVKSAIKAKATKVLEAQLDSELSDDLSELSIGELKARGLLNKKVKYDKNRDEEND